MVPVFLSPDGLVFLLIAYPSPISFILSFETRMGDFQP